MPSFAPTPREARWLGGRLRTLNPPLPAYSDVGRGSARHIVYGRQGTFDAHVVNGETVEVQSSWLIYISQPVPSGTTAYIEDLQDDADRLDATILDRAGAGVVGGCFVQALKRDTVHDPPIYAGNTLVELQLGGIYIISTQPV